MAGVSITMIVAVSELMRRKAAESRERVLRTGKSPSQLINRWVKPSASIRGTHRASAGCLALLFLFCILSRAWAHRSPGTVCI